MKTLLAPDLFERYVNLWINLGKIKLQQFLLCLSTGFPSWEKWQENFVKKKHANLSRTSNLHTACALTVCIDQLQNRLRASQKPIFLIKLSEILDSGWSQIGRFCAKVAYSPAGTNLLSSFLGSLWYYWHKLKPNASNEWSKLSVNLYEHLCRNNSAPWQLIKVHLIYFPCV